MKFNEMKYERPDFDVMSQKMNAYVNHYYEVSQWNKQQILKTVHKLKF